MAAGGLRTPGQLKLCDTAVRSSRTPGSRRLRDCLLYTSDAADERSSVDLGGRRIIKKKTRVALERRKQR